MSIIAARPKFHPCCALVGALLFLSPTSGIALPNQDATEEWAWSQIKADEIADFNVHCGGILHAPESEADWQDHCRRLSPSFLENILLTPRLRDQIPRRRIRITGANIEGTFDLSDADITTEVWLVGARIGGDLNLNDSHLTRLLSLDGSTVTGKVFADRMHSDSSVFIRTLSLLGQRAIFQDEVSLREAKIDGALILQGTQFAGDFIADGLQVGKNMAMSEDVAFIESARMVEAKVGNDLSMDNVRFVKGLLADSLTIGGSLSVDNASKFLGDVQMHRARIAGDLSLNNSWFYKDFDVEGANVQGAVFIRSGSIFGGDLDLAGTKLGRLELGPAAAARVDLDGLTGGEFFINGMTWVCPDSMTANQVTDEKIALNSWPLGDPAWHKAMCHGSSGREINLVLRNAHVDLFEDGPDTWPASIELGGFRYNSFGPNDSKGDNIRNRPIALWLDWLERDRDFSPQSYVQLATTMRAEGPRQ